MNSFLLTAILLVYLGTLFFIAQWAEKKAHFKWTNNPLVYTLSIAVYCTAWTYYGSIGMAANSGLTYLAIYIGPITIVPAWIIILRKVIRISKANKISTIADFISLRYGNSRIIGGLVTLICLAGILPYISLQLKAISETFHLVTDTGRNNLILYDTTTYITIIIALFATYYGTRYVDASEKRKGVITVIALESIVKLVFFLIVGIYVTFFVFDGFDDIYTRASALPGFVEKNTIGGLPQAINWFFLCLASLLAIFLLPRQFHVAVVENNRERHLKTVLWVFPLYLLLFNLFVYPIAWGGNILFNGRSLNADFYSLLIPLEFANTALVIFVFLGGLSAALSMIVVSSISLANMLSNNILIPYTFLGRLQNQDQQINNKRIVDLRRIGIFSLIIISYFLYRLFALNYSLVSIGLISFVVIAQLAPSFFGAIFWRRGSALGALAGMIAGFAVCAYTILIPFAIGVSDMSSAFITHGPFNIHLLKPFQLFGLDYLNPIPHSLFWSLLVNTLAYIAVSVSFKGNYRERNYAEMYVDIDQYTTNNENAFVWKGTAYTRDIEKVLIRFLGEDRTRRALNIFNQKYSVDKKQELADARLIRFSENLLRGHIGTASAKILISSVVKEEKLSLNEVLRILEESKENIAFNRKLIETSNELQRTTIQLKSANEALLIKDRQKDDFLDTVTHELRTPITAIRAASEILHDDDAIPEELKKQFLQNIISESDRLNRLIDNIMDLEKFESGKQSIHVTENNLSETVKATLNSLEQLIKNKKIKINVSIPDEANTVYDEDRIRQVLTNLISNAIKFCYPGQGIIDIRLRSTDEFFQISVKDNGKGIEESDLKRIFEKFFQSGNQNIKKPFGSGLGLAISKQIIEHHKGEIWAYNNVGDGACFNFTLPKSTSL